MKSSSSSKPLLKCYCNDDSMCPPTRPPSVEIDPAQSLNESYLKSLDLSTLALNATRYCTTNSVCMTKKLKKTNGNTWLKYYCSHLSTDSIRDQIIEYRDCKMIGKVNQQDQKLVKETAAEYCCDTQDFCNLHLVPERSITTL
jgi:hypothetical protein